MTDEQEFDDWFNDGEAADTALENQAAKFDDRMEEARTLRTEDFSKGTNLAGEIFFRFTAPDGGKKMKHGSGHIVKKLDSGEYIALTSRQNVTLKFDDGTIATADSGMFFTQRNGKETFKARFSFNGDGVKKFRGDEMDDDAFPSDENAHLIGTNLAALVMKHNKGEAPEVPDLQAFDKDVVGVQACMSGYPDVVVNSKATDANGKAQKDKIMFQCYSMDGPIEAIDNEEQPIVTFSMDTSAGQQGGALTNDDGKVLAIYTGVAAPNTEAFSVGVLINESVVEWVNEIEAE